MENTRLACDRSPGRGTTEPVNDAGNAIDVAAPRSHDQTRRGWIGEELRISGLLESARRAAHLLTIQSFHEIHRTLQLAWIIELEKTSLTLLLVNLVELGAELTRKAARAQPTRRGVGKRQPAASTPSCSN